MNIHLQDKIAVVTGGTSGIGLSTAEAFARAGAQVAICSSSQANVDTALDYLKKQGLNTAGWVVDVGDKESIFDFADLVEKKYGGIDIWVSNAGIYPQYKIIDTPEEVWDRLMDINIKSVYFGGRIAADKLRKRGGGVLLNGASFASLMPSVGSGGYAATKAAVYSMTKTLAAELAPFNIRVNGYIPGVIETKMTNKLIEAKKEQLEKPIALQKIGCAQDVANALLFLASDFASYITGTFIEISGGKFCVQNAQDAWR